MTSVESAGPFVDSPAPTLTVVGSGTLLPDPRRRCASFHLAAGGHSLLLDAGSGTLHGLPRAGVNWRAIDVVAVTHFHPDHVCDLPALLAAYRYEEATAPLTLVGPPGFDGYMDRMAALHGPWIREPSRPLAVVEVEPGRAWWSDDERLGLEAVSTPHTEESVAYRVTSRLDRGTRGSSTAGESDGTVVVGFTGDTGPSVELHESLRGCEILVAECALMDPPEIDSHLSPRSVAELATATEPTLLLVSHVYPPQTPAQAVAAVAESYAGRVVAARDGMRVRISEAGVAVDPPPGGP